MDTANLPSKNKVDYVIDHGESYSIAVSYRYQPELDAKHVWKLVEEFEEGRKGDPEKGSQIPRSSRNAFKKIEISEDFSVLLRKYQRGGFVSKFNKESYLSTSTNSVAKLRPFREIDITEFLFSKGVAVPPPVACVVSWKQLGIIYEAYILTEYVEDSRNLVEFGAGIHGDLAACESFSNICYKAGTEARKMLIAGVLHPDLHLGNVLVDASSDVTLIDFDKATYFTPKKTFKTIIEKMCARWHRSAEKHGLVAQAVSPFTRGMFEPGELG